ncbi:MAG: hypothetical protein V8R42_02195 [Clostridia bacterium]
MQIFGGALFKPIFQFVCGIGDIAIEIMQGIFLTNKTSMYVSVGSINQYIIRYSPGIIFSGKIPALDINFINPQASEDTKQYCTQAITIYHERLPDKGNEAIIKYAKDKHKCPEELMRATLDRIKTKNDSASTQWGEKTFSDAQSCLNYLLSVGTTVFAIGGAPNNPQPYPKPISIEEISSIFEKTADNKVTVNLGFLTTNIADIEAARPETIYIDLEDGTQESFNGVFYVELNYVKNLTEGKISVAKQLQPTIAKWYKTTRLIAIVGLLSILVYVGIRIILSSTGQDKSKYKKMFMDWLTALCLLFILHYIMAFILEISSMLTKIFLNNVMDNQNKDILMSSLRSSIELDQTFRGTASLAIMYVALVILTVTFTFQYLKRVIYMAFLTMIAPLIALTYPLDKIKDGQAQAFGMWLREYIFNSLLQVVHLFVYCLLVGSSMDFILVNPIYGIVAITFIVPAEKFIRKMFGFEKATTVGTLGAAAGGAAVMSMVNKMRQAGGHKGQQGQQGQQESKEQGKTRTATRKPNWGTAGLGTQTGTTTTGTQTGTTTTGTQTGTQTGTTTTETQTGTTTTGTTTTGTQTGTTTTGTQTGTQTGTTTTGTQTGGAKPTLARPGVKGGLRAVGRRFTRKGGPLRKLGITALKSLGGLAGATIGIAAGVASGDLSKAAQYGVAGAAAGYASAGKLGNTGLGVVNKVKSYADTYRQGYNGNSKDEKNRKFDEKFMKSEECKQLVEQYTTDTKDKKEVQSNIGEMLEYGIQDPKQMDIALKNNYGANEASQYIKLASKCPESMAYDREAFKKFLENHPDSNIQELIQQHPDELNRLYEGMHAFK